MKTLKIAGLVVVAVGAGLYFWRESLLAETHRRDTACEAAARQQFATGHTFFAKTFGAITGRDEASGAETLVLLSFT